MYLKDPYTVSYKSISAVCDDNKEYVEIIEQSNCYGGSAWAKYHYSKSPLVISSRAIGNTIRYLVKTGVSDYFLKPSYLAAGIESVLVKGDEIEITYIGLGGGGVGATTCRAYSKGALRYFLTESGGSKSAKGTIVVPKLSRLLIGVDDTDSKEVGATWTLVHNIANTLDKEDTRYISHSIVQLYPVPAKTQNCVSTVVEFFINPKNKKKLLSDFKSMVSKYSVSQHTGMVAYSNFDAKILKEYGQKCRQQEITYEFAMETAKNSGVEVLIDGRGIIGALAAIPYFAQPEEAVILS